VGKFARQFISIALIAGVAAAFQNCSGGFESSHATFQSSQCAAKARAKVSELPIDHTALNCQNLDNYECDIRNFGADLEDSTKEERVCSGSRCVTAAIRNYKAAEDFQQGEEYNRQEIRCYHLQLYKGVALFQSEGDTLEQALDGAIAACTEAER
jgi:hypothetical protein